MCTFFPTLLMAYGLNHSQSCQIPLSYKDDYFTFVRLILLPSTYILSKNVNNSHLRFFFFGLVEQTQIQKCDGSLYIKCSSREKQ